MAISKRSTKKGGSGTADHAIAVYGDAMQQHPVSATDNTIAMNNVGAPVQSGAGLAKSISALSESFFGKQGDKKHMLAQLQGQVTHKLESMGTEGGKMDELHELQTTLAVKGGKLTKKNLKHIKRKMTGGSGVLENVALPAILLYINQRVGSKKNLGSKKLRKSARISRKLNQN